MRCSNAAHASRNRSRAAVATVNLSVYFFMMILYHMRYTMLIHDNACHNKATKNIKSATAFSATVRWKKQKVFLMNIDLLVSNSGDIGFVASEIPAKKLAGVILEKSTGLVTYEFQDMEIMELNIAVDEEFYHSMNHTSFVHIGSYMNDHIAQAYQVPLMFQDDPYRGEFLAARPPPASPLLAFEHFIKNCIAGQPVHRANLGDESNAGCILGEAVPSSLEFAPHLARRHALEATPSGPSAAPAVGPSTPGGPGGMGGGGSYGSGSDGDS
jgi:hypothetical protein